MKAETLVRTPDPRPEQRPLIALEAQLGELRHSLDFTLQGINTSACDTGLDSVPRRGRGRPPKFTPAQRQFLMLEAQFAKLRTELEETLSFIDVQKGLRTL